MKTVGIWNEGLDDVIKIGWPWHGALQQVSPTMYTLTSPTGEVVNLPAGDLSHALSYPVSLTGATSWRTGKCQRYQIPGIPPAVTTPAERADGMTWLNYFIKSGIADFGLGYNRIIDASGKPWLIKLRYTSFVPSAIEIWHNVNGTIVKRNEISITPPSQPFVRTLSTLYRNGLTVSSNGCLMAFNYFDIDNPEPIWSFSITITGSVLDNTLAAEITKLLDSDMPGMERVEDTGSIFTGNYTASRDHALIKSTWLGTGWSAWELTGQTETTSIAGSWGPIGVSYIDGRGLEYPAWPSAKPDDTDTETYRWAASGSSLYAANETYYSHRNSIKCIGFFIGHDDSIVRVDSVSGRSTAGTASISEGSADETMHGTTTYSDYLIIGGRESIRISDYDEYSGVNQATITKYAGPRGVVVNLLADGYRAVALANTVNDSLKRYSYICAQVADASLFPSTFSTSSSFPTPPNFSIHPVTGAILTRPDDGYPVSWV